MSFEEMVNERAGQGREGARQELEARSELLRTFAAAGRTAARSMRNSLTAAAHTLSRHAVPADLAVVTGGPDGTGRDYKVIGEGWDLTGDRAVLAFLTVDGKIFLDARRRRLPGRYLSPHTAEAGNEKRSLDATLGGEPVRLDNPDGPVPGTGKLIELGREGEGQPLWTDKPEVLIGFGAGGHPLRPAALWPRDVSISTPGTRFDRNGRVWLTYSDEESHHAVELDRWLVDRLAARLT